MDIQCIIPGLDRRADSTFIRLWTIHLYNGIYMNIQHGTWSFKEVAKKFISLVARPQRGGGAAGKGLLATKKNTFFEALKKSSKKM